ncbi:MAG: DUF362 domain-containing protein [Lachnospiraceae bacterium]|nr:DUF362 domain-containing protein [Candidatus Colinaster scatohippi]
MSKVYFTTFKATMHENLLQKLHRLMKTAGFEEIDFNEKYAAIKIHFGELGNLAFLRPNYAKVVADYVKEQGGKPFLTDCNTLYVGSRKNALDHMETAYLNGFSPMQTGCHVIIADGLKGTDEALVPIDGEYVKEAKIGQAIMDADIFISLNHFKGHEMAGFGGAIKNIGMGCGSRAGKMEQHCEGKPSVDQSGCVGCGACGRICAHGAPEIVNGKATINHDKCVGCGRCLAVCPKDVIEADFADSVAKLNYKMAEYAYAVCKDRPTFHISLICDVSPNCDCHAENDIPIIPNVGMLASFDPVALDQACADLCNKMPINPGSVLDDNAHDGHSEEDVKKYPGHNHAHGACDHTDHFDLTHPDAEWETCLAHAEKIGLGERVYDLIRI